MTAISQKYNTYLQGMSDQPDEIMKPGQLKDSVNTFPDVTFGLLKRPSLGFTKYVDTPDVSGCWGSYYRVTNTGQREEYILQVLRNGRIRVFDAVTGDKQTVNIGGTINDDGSVSGGNTGDNATLTYGVHTANRDIQFTTILDTTVINNRTIRPRMSSTVGDMNHTSPNYYAFVAITQLAYGQSYTLDVQHGTNTVQQVTFNTPSNGATATSVENILDGGNDQDGLVADLLALTDADMGNGQGTDAFFSTCIRIGNGIYLESDSQFTVNTPEGQLFDLMAVYTDVAATDKHGQKRYAAIQNVASLPLECRHNMVLKVKNSIASEDDYYVRFQGNQGKDGEGTWEETVEPGNYNKLEPSVMPHRIVRGPKSGNIYTFVVQPIPWDDRLVGDPQTNPFPSFINKDNPDSDLNRPPIEKTFFYRNRFCMLAGENIIMSRPGDYFNLWSVSALNVSVSDPIDTAASSNYSSLLLDAIVVNSGLVLFSEFQQFLLTTDSDILSSQTVKINNLASYDFNPLTSPFAMGNTIGFFSTAGVNSRLYEMFQIFREGEPDVIEQSKILNRRLPKDLTEIAESKENGLIMSAAFDSRDLWCYRYFNQGTERLQSAWFRWTIMGDLQYHVIMGDVYYAILQEQDKDGTERISLVNMDLADRFSTTDVSGVDFEYRIHMDYAKSYSNSDLTKDGNGYTTFSIADYPVLNDNLYAYTLDGGGKYQKVITDGSNTAKVKGDWTGSGVTLNIGYNYRMEVDFPRMFLNSDNTRGGVTDLTASLTIHRCKLSMGPQGVYETVLQRVGKDNYTQKYESAFPSSYKANSVPYLAHRMNTIPVYSQNYKFNLSLQSEHPGPCTLYSMTWEGMYTSLNYRRA